MSVSQEEKSSVFKKQIGGNKRAKAPESGPKFSKFGIPPLPQVNLMPPEIIEGRKLAILKRRLLWSIVALLLVCVLAFAGAYLVKVAAEERHEDALTMADTLAAQKRQYSPVIQVQKDIKNTEAGRSFALSTEVEWSSYVYAIEGVLPEGVTIESMTISGIGPGDDLASGADDLTRAGIAVISFSALSATLPDASEWIEALQSVPGLADANLQSSTLQDESGEIIYKVAATVQVTEDALAKRTFESSVAPTKDADPGDASEED